MQEISSGLKPKERLWSHSYSRMTVNFCRDLSYRRAAEVMNSCLHREPGEDVKSRTLADFMGGYGNGIVAHIKNTTKNILAENKFDAGTLLPLNSSSIPKDILKPGCQMPGADDAGHLRDVCGAVDEINSSREGDERIEALTHGRQISFIKPTIAMDRGIATHENIDYLKANGYPYVVIRREDGSEEFRQVFEEERGTFTLASEGRRSIYGDDNKVFIRKEQQASEGICKVLCISEGKAKKEQAIDARKDNRFLEAVRLLDNSVQNGRIKDRAKIDARLDKIKSRHRNAAECYTLEVLGGNGGTVSGISAVRKADVQGKLFGCYVIETTHTELDDVSIWNLYMTLTKVESAFRALKSELGMRPVYHQNAGRTAAHLFIGVLAYHMLAVIERELRKDGDNREWASVRKVLSTHTRCTVSMRDADGSTHHIRVSGTPEGSHREVYAMLGARDPLKRIHSQIGKN